MKDDRPGERKSLNNWLSALKDFERARARASREEIWARLSGKPAELLCYEDVPEQLRAVPTTSHGLQDIPLDAIVGSVGRCTDFTRSFLPRRDHVEARWAKVEVAWDTMAGLPPIDVYQIGQVYFVLDGNHRVSVARQLGLTSIEAYVTELHTKVPLSPDDRPDDLIVKAEYAEFLGRTRLDELRPDADLSTSVPGQYRELEEQISACRHPTEVDQRGETPYEDAVTRWYDTVYLPAVRIIREQSILRDFPGRTETDLYVWILRHRTELGQELACEIGSATGISDLVEKLGRRPDRVFARVTDRVKAILRGNR